MQPKVFYTDVPRQHKHIAKRCFPCLGEGLYPGDLGVRGDVMHLLANHSDNFASGHCLARDAADELAATLKVRPGGQTRQPTAYEPHADAQLVARTCLLWVGGWVGGGGHCTDGNTVLWPMMHQTS